MTAALMDALTRIEPTSAGARSSRSGAAATSFDEVISEVVAQADEAPADRERPPSTKKRHHGERADDDKGHRAAQAGLSVPLPTTTDHRAHQAGPPSPTARRAAVEDGSTAQRSGTHPTSPAAHIRHRGASSATSAARYDAPHHQAVSDQSGEGTPARSGETVSGPSTRPQGTEVLQQSTTIARQTSPENKAVAARPAPVSASGDQERKGVARTAHPAAAPAPGVTADDAKSAAAATAKVPADGGQNPASTTAANPAKVVPAARDGLAGKEHSSDATVARQAMREAPPVRETSYLRTTAGARPTQQAKPQPTAVNAPVIPMHLSAASATTVGSTPAVAPAAPTVPMPLAQPDVAAILASLRGGPDGTYQLRAQVHPAELGSVNITATVAGGSLTVLLTGDTQAHQALSQALPQLRSHLADQGFTGVDVGLGSPDQQAGQTGSGSGEHHTQGSDRPLGTEVGPDGSADTRPATPLRRAAGAIDTML